MSEEKEIGRPLSIIIVCALLGLMQAGVLITRVFQKQFSDPGIFVTIAIIIGLLALWKMKRWGMWVTILSMTLIAYLYTSKSDRPIRDFFYTGFPIILMVVACTYPHRNRMS